MAPTSLEHQVYELPNKKDKENTQQRGARNNTTLHQRRNVAQQREQKDPNDAAHEMRWQSTDWSGTRKSFQVRRRRTTAVRDPCDCRQENQVTDIFHHVSGGRKDGRRYSGNVIVGTSRNQWRPKPTHEECKSPGMFTNGLKERGVDSEQARVVHLHDRGHDVMIREIRSLDEQWDRAGPQRSREQFGMNSAIRSAG